ncbi:MAG: hypothetical protein IJ455_04065 [Agathobacter sp.]|nr:hypothetical protein [Agathobacter sp.]
MMILSQDFIFKTMEVLFYIFLACLAFPIIYIVVSLLIGFVVGIIYKIFYTQIGPTCGYYGLVYAIGKVKDINLKQEVRRIIKCSIDEDKSYVGEIFEINKLSEIAEKYFPDIDTSIKTFNGIEELDELLKNHYLVYPVLRKSLFGKLGDTPHYYFIEEAKKGKYIYKTEIFKIRLTKKKSEMVEENVNLKQLDYFCWNCYYKKKRSLFVSIAYYIADWNLYSFLNKQYKDKKKVLLNQYSKIDMAGKALAIRKKKL